MQVSSLDREWATPLVDAFLCWAYKPWPLVLEHAISLQRSFAKMSCSPEWVFLFPTLKTLPTCSNWNPLFYSFTLDQERFLFCFVLLITLYSFTALSLLKLLFKILCKMLPNIFRLVFHLFIISLFLCRLHVFILPCSNFNLSLSLSLLWWQPSSNTQLFGTSALSRPFTSKYIYLSSGFCQRCTPPSLKKIPKTLIFAPSFSTTSCISDFVSSYSLSFFSI